VAFLGAANLALFVAVAGPRSGDGPSLIGWPIVLLLMAGGLLAIGLRPREDLPPEPPMRPADGTAVTERMDPPL
jgi:hypothetical protein